VTLLVAPARLAGPGRAEMARLEAALDAAVAEMAPRVPLPELQEPGTPVAAVRPSLPAAAAIGPAAPIVVVVEDDFVAQARPTCTSSITPTTFSPIESRWPDA
jgi:hypothetical protein